MAGMLHSDVTGNLESGSDWLRLQLQKIVFAPSVESAPEWASCIRYAITGKERSGTRAPVLRQKVLYCLCTAVPQSMATSVLAKRYSFLSVALIEISPCKMSPAEEQYHVKFFNDLLDNLSHSSAQVTLDLFSVRVPFSLFHLSLFELILWSHLRKFSLSNLAKSVSILFWKD